MKNAPARTRPGLRSRSSYSNPQRDGGVKSPFMYSAWARADMHGGGNVPRQILDELALARRNPRAFKMRKETPLLAAE